MKGAIQSIKNSQLLKMTGAVVAGTFLVVGFVSAATTISTNIQTDGTLSVTGLSTLLGGATTTSITLLNGATIGNSTVNEVDIGGGGATDLHASGDVVALFDLSAIRDTYVGRNALITGIASTTQMRVGAGTESLVSSIVFGTCTLTTVTPAATSTAYTTCTGATGVTSSDKVFMQAGTLPAGIILDSASSTATAGTIEVRVNNVDAGAATATGAVVIPFFAIH
jgi:hypothetical protein